MLAPVEPGGDPPTTSRHLSTFHIEALRLGAATRPEQNSAEKHLADCARCREVAAAWEASLREFADVAYARTREPLRARAHRPAPAPARRKPLGWAAIFVAAAATGLVAVWRAPSPKRAVDDGPAEPVLGVKGGLDFVVAARRGDRVFHVGTDPLRAGDQIRFVLDGVSSSYLMVGSVDGSGHANIYVPYEGTESVAVVSRFSDPRHVEVEGSIVLDAAPGPERVFALISERPLAAGPVRSALSTIGAAGPDAIRETDALALPPQLLAAAGTLVQRSVLIEKGRE